MGFYGIFWLFIAYAIPVGLFIYLYSKVIFSLRERRQNNVKHSSCGVAANKSGSKVLKAADQQITRTAIIVTIAFFFSLSWDSWYCFLGFPGIIEYKFNSKLQVMGVFLAAFNSCTNPFIYAASMSIFRRSLRKTFHCQNGNFDSETKTTGQSVVALTLRQLPVKDNQFGSRTSKLEYVTSNA